MNVRRRRRICPLRGHLKGRMQYAPTLPANRRQAHTLETISGANGWRWPLSDVRVGAQKHTPPMFPVGNNSTRQASAAIEEHFGGE